MSDTHAFHADKEIASYCRCGAHRLASVHGFSIEDRLADAESALQNVLDADVLSFRAIARNYFDKWGICRQWGRLRGE